MGTELREVEALAVLRQCLAAERRRPIRERMASLLRDRDIDAIVEGITGSPDGEPETNCGGQTIDPPCGGCDRCLIDQGMYYLPSWPEYLSRADDVLAAADRAAGEGSNDG